MPSINFKPEFAEAVKNGTKRQTIRQVRKNPIKPGDMLTMFTGQRTKDCRKLCMHKCKSVEEIEITIEKFEYPPVAQEAYDVLKTPNLPIDYVNSVNNYIHSNEEQQKRERWIVSIKINGVMLKVEAMNELSDADGFKDAMEFCRFFNSHYGPNFKGVLIKW